MAKITLKNEMETLLITLYSKAVMSETNQIIIDKKAEEVIKMIDYDFKKLGVNKKTQVFMALRSVMIDGFVQEYLRENPHALVLHLGCGLDFRQERIDAKNIHWYDLDYPQVIQLKRQFCKESEHYRFIASSVNDLKWLESVEYSPQNVLVIAEGLTMYLSAEEIEGLITSLNHKFNNITYIFDVYSELSVKLTKNKWNNLLNRTGAQIKWGIDDPKELEHLGIQYLKTLYLNDSSFVKTIKSRYFRFMFKLTMKSKIVNRAMCILVFKKGGANESV